MVWTTNTESGFDFNTLGKTAADVSNSTASNWFHFIPRKPRRMNRLRPPTPFLSV